MEDIGITASKETEFSEWYMQVVIRAELADYAPVKGLIVLRPDGYAIWELLQKTLDDRFAAGGVRNGFLPLLIPESLLGKEKKHFAGFNPEVFWVTHSGDSKVGDRLALRPTSETLAYSMYSKWIRSWRDLPLKINFWNTALRAEIKSTKPFLRTSEFLWQEGHTVHATSKEAQEQVKRILDVYRDVVEQEMAIPAVAGRKSESEKFVGAVYTTTIESMMPDGRALQMGTSHFLGRNFSVPFEVKFADKNNQERFGWQTSWGVSWRLIGAMIMVHGDDRGLSLPPRMAPIQVVIVPVYFSDKQEEAVVASAQQIARTLNDSGIRAHLDDRQELTPGFKYHDWELRGVPLRLEIGPREIRDHKIVTTLRYDGTKSHILMQDVVISVKSILADIQSAMLDRARDVLRSMTHDVSDYATFRDMMGGGGFFNMSWCGNAACEEKIKEDTGADVRVIPFGGKHHSQTCVVCSEPARYAAYFGRGY